jgi:hypothetical protein
MIEFSLPKSIEILERTPATLASLLSELSEEWLCNNEGGDSWSPFIIVGHLIQGERTDWIVRAKAILEFGESRPFEPFDRFAQFKDTKGKSAGELLEEFRELRSVNLSTLKELDIKPADLLKTGLHPVFGRVTLRELIATWAVHDLGHIRQIARVMAKQYKNDVGPWGAFLPVVNE